MTPKTKRGEHFLKVKEAASQLNVCEKTIRRRTDNGEIPTTRVGRCVRIDAADLADYIGAKRRGVK